MLADVAKDAGARAKSAHVGLFCAQDAGQGGQANCHKFVGRGGQANGGEEQ